MALTRNVKIFIGVGVIVAISAALVPSIVIPLSNRNNETIINFTLLYNAGVMIEVDDLRIYFDPSNLGSYYLDYPADYVFYTHPHSDHYQMGPLSLIQKEGTINVFPANMSAEIAYHDGIGVNPGDEIAIGPITVTAYYMYTLPVDEFPASHPKEANWTSYIIDINGFTFFHAGDSKNIPEYEDIAGTIDVALLPLGPGCQTMVDMEVVEAAEALEASYLIPIHFGEGIPETFIANYGQYLENCEIIHIEYWSSYEFIV
ncbi:MAG: MBL fold metallo-hydrolase [Asgard group archaeon]|nr:MBL fold metallo-hydrolase [Asgard group archaeon]